MSFRSLFPSPSPNSGTAAAREPLLTPATAPRSAPASARGNSFSLFGSPSSPPPVDTHHGFDSFNVVFTPAIPLNVLDGALAEIESDIVNQFFETGSTDPLIISERLEPILITFRRSHPEIREKEIKRAIARVLDEINFYGQGCSQVQITRLKQDLARLNQETASFLEEEGRMSMAARLFAWTKESKEQKMEREAEETKKDERKQRREYQIGLLERRIPYCETLREQLMSDSLLSKFNANDARECAFVRFCRDTFSGEDDLCGRATIESMASGGVVDIPEPVKIKFELVIAGDGLDSDTTSVRLTRFCQFASSVSEKYLPFNQVYAREEDRARQIKEDVKNALFNQFRGTPDGNVETHGLVVMALEPKRCASVGKNDRLFEDPNKNSCCIKCNILGGAKKIKRARQSKKKKVRRSKLKSKRVRRKNKSRRN